jgi:transcriptional regulator with XRE-family HTH domain
MVIATRPFLSDARSAVLADLPAALTGDEAAARRYARAWRALVRELLATGAGAPAAAGDVLDHLALTAPFAPGGPLGALMSAAAGIMPATTGTVPSTAPLELPDSLDYQRFARIVLQELSGDGTGLERVMAAWQLSVADVARLFGVARQAVQQWLGGGVPPARQPKLATVRRVADLLERNLQPDRIPAVVRTPADAYGGRSMLQMIGSDDHDELLASVERSFDWSATA